MSHTFIGSAPQQANFPVLFDALGKLANLNTVAQIVCTRLSDKFIRAGVMIRCDELPEVTADENDLVFVFEQALRSILNECSTQNVLIHIKNASAPDAAMVNIDICTNVAVDAFWKEQQREILEGCSAICKKNGGSFMYNVSTRCASLFTIALPVKQNITTLG